MKFSAGRDTSIPGTVYGIDNVLIEGNTNNLASQYIVDNYDKLSVDVLRMGIDGNKNTDLINDVYCAIVEKEQNGEGYDSGKGKTGDYIEVKHFVYKMLSSYGQNVRYKKQKITNPKFREISSSCSNEDIGELTVNQIIYRNARGYDEIEGLDERLSILAEIEFVLGFEATVELNLRFLLKNVRGIADQLTSIDTAIFNPLKRLVKRNDELKNSLRAIIKFAVLFPDVYDAIVEGI